MLNRVILLGRLGRDPELRQTQGGTAVCKFSLATWRFRSKDGQEREQVTEWHNVCAFGRLAEVCGQYLKKGGVVLVEGEMQTRSWEKDGIKRQITEVLANQMQMIPTGGAAQADAAKGAPPKSAQRPDYDGTKWKPGRQTSWEDRQREDDIPF